MKQLFFLLFTFSVCSIAQAQKAVVIPFQKKGEVIRAIIDDDPCYRMIETKIKELALTEGDLQLIDYKALVTKIGKDKLRDIRERGDLIKLLIQESDPDIYIIADVESFKRKHSRTGKMEHSLVLNLTAHQTHTGRTVAAASLDSGWWIPDNCADLMHQIFLSRDENGNRKINTFIEQLLVNPQSTVSIHFSLSKSAEYSYMDKLSNDVRLAREIEGFIKKVSPDKEVRSDGSGSTFIKFNEVLLPTGKEKMNANDLMYNLLDHLEQFTFKEGEELKFEVDLVGNTITFTLQ